MKRGPLLIDFFQRSFVPDVLADASPKRLAKWESAIRSLSRSLRHRARVDELTRENCRRLLKSMAAAGKSYNHLRRVRDRLNALWKYAHRLELTGPPDMPRVAAPPTERPRVPGELAKFFELSFRPAKLADKHSNYLWQFRRALRLFNKFLGRPAAPADLTANNILGTLNLIKSEGASRRHARTLVKRLRTLRRYAVARKLLAPLPDEPHTRLKPLSFSARTQSMDALNPETLAMIDEAPSPDWRLREFYSKWYLPIVLAGERPTKRGTVEMYLVALDWWERLTGNPTLAEIASRTKGRLILANFSARLREATYRRGLTQDGKETGAVRPLSEASVARILRTLRSILRRLGPERQTDDNAYAELFDRAPRLKVPTVRGGRVRPPFAIADARAIAAACKDMKMPVGQVAPGDWWLALISTLYFTGLRIGTVMRLEWAMVIETPEGYVLDVPSRIVQKTGKGIRKPLHADCIAAMNRIRTKNELLFPWKHSLTYIRRKHERLQALAGLPAERIQSPHAWRRTHGVEMARVGAHFAMETARRALDHSDVMTTSGSYVDLEAEFIAKLPRLVEGPP